MRSLKTTNPELAYYARRKDKLMGIAVERGELKPTDFRGFNPDGSKTLHWPSPESRAVRVW